MMRGAAGSRPINSKTIHVANLNPEMKSEMLRSVFGHFGAGPTSFAFVDFATESAAEAALSMSGQEFAGRRLRVERAKEWVPTPGSIGPPQQQSAPRAVPMANVQIPAPQCHMPCYAAASRSRRRARSAEIWVGSLTHQTTNDMLRSYFAQFGLDKYLDAAPREVLTASVMTDRASGQSRGFGFVTFASQAHVNAVLDQQPHVINGRTANVAVRFEFGARQWRRGAGGGGTTKRGYTRRPTRAHSRTTYDLSSRNAELAVPSAVIFAVVLSRLLLESSPPRRREVDERSLRSEENLDNLLDGGGGLRKRDGELSPSERKRSRFSAPLDPEPTKAAVGSDEKVALIVDHLFDGTAKLNEYATKVEADTRSALVEVPTVPAAVASQPVFVQFYQASHAIAAAENLSSRTYDGRRLVVKRVSRHEMRTAVVRGGAEIVVRYFLSVSVQDEHRRGKLRSTDVVGSAPANKPLASCVFRVALLFTSRAEPDLDKPSRVSICSELDAIRRERDDVRRELGTINGRRDAEMARLRSDLAHHSTQHKLLQARVDELEDELEKARASARRRPRVKALAERADTLESDRTAL
ncbi:hypothetical protein CTAYLR_002064 [Chrysophaeum taylorii]|uniref:RRM domain-containing protein n=1 Tax=Chrysophaeum taylorii TaxID=2483200 RepID=A0AAD7UML8_9STRA|nr:hypothetical protein CTAYLR_002064 [Chrysophaeum taylorii]